MKRILCIAAAGAFGCSQAAQPPATAPATGPPTHTVPASTDGFAPIAYYEEHCSRCHGQFGTGYLPDMGKRLSDNALRKVIREMAEGPAGAPLDHAQLEAETAYHRSLLDGAPFLARTDAKALRGEVSDGATVSVSLDGKIIPAITEGHLWQVRGVSGQGVTILAERGGRRTVLEAGQPFSHVARK